MCVAIVKERVLAVRKGKSVMDEVSARHAQDSDWSTLPNIPAEAAWPDMPMLRTVSAPCIMAQ